MRVRSPFPRLKALRRLRWKAPRTPVGRAPMSSVPLMLRSPGREMYHPVHSRVSSRGLSVGTTGCDASRTR
eukprot:6152873-Alexandrium_andersonii.AAC.1